MPATRLARGGPGALASPALGPRHEPAESVVVVQHVEFRAEAALRIPGEPLIRERLELKRGVWRLRSPAERSARRPLSRRFPVSAATEAAGS